MKPPYKYDGLDEAIVGVGHTSVDTELVVYSYEKIIKCLEKDMSKEDAHEFAAINILGMHIGEGQPIVLFEAPPDVVLDYMKQLTEE